MRKLHKQTGFTLAELLIVVAIIAILVAIGIPAFSTAMERSRETVDLSNLRGAYAEFMAETLGGSKDVGYFKINVKQRIFGKETTDSDWIIDTSGFTSNLSDGAMPNLTETGDTIFQFYIGKTSEKPVCKVVSKSDWETLKSTVSGDLDFETPRYTKSGS